MLRKATSIIGIFVTCSLLWFAVYDYRQAAPIAEENLRGTALSVTAAIENLAANDPTLAGLANFRPGDIAYFALVDSRGIYRFHSNPDLVGSSMNGTPSRETQAPARSEQRVTLGTGELAYHVVAPVNLPGETLYLHLTLHTYRADAVVRRAKLNMTILLGLVAAGWVLSLGLYRYARREELHQIELARKENLAKLGEMGAVLAHEIRNPLAGIKGFAQVIAKKPQEERNSAFAQSIVTEAVRLENLVNELLAYAGSDGPARTPLDLAELLDHTVSLLAPEAAGLNVAIARESPANLHLTGNRDRLEQVLLNLGRNALQAMPSGGVLEISALPAGRDAVITVKDSGFGISEQDLPMVFEPFFTTKARGTGLGLALCKKIVEEHDGSISLESRIDRGTTVTVTLPGIAG